MGHVPRPRGHSACEEWKENRESSPRGGDTGTEGGKAGVQCLTRASARSNQKQPKGSKTDYATLNRSNIVMSYLSWRNMF